MINDRRKIGEKTTTNGRRAFSADAECGRRKVLALAREAAALAIEASTDGLDAATAIMAAAIHVSFPEDMSRRDIADWFRRFADEIEGDTKDNLTRQ